MAILRNNENNKFDFFIKKKKNENWISGLLYPPQGIVGSFVYQAMCFGGGITVDGSTNFVMCHMCFSFNGTVFECM